MYRVKFIGERGRIATTEVVIAGFVFRKGQELRLGSAQMAALRAHPQFGKFEFDISEVVRAVTEARVPASRAKKLPAMELKKKREAVKPPGSGTSEEVTEHGDYD